jgi:hypothetical protein
MNGCDGMPQTSRRADALIERGLTMLTVGFHSSVTRWVAGLAGCVLAALGATAALLRLSAADPLVTALAVSVAVWFAWVVIDYALTPLRVAQDKGRKAAHAVAHPPPEFLDTQSTWKAHGQESVDGYGRG